MNTKKPSRREIGLNLIKFAGYHNKPYQLIAIEYRISYEVAREYHSKGWQAKQAGVKCNCMECAEAVKNAPKWELIEKRGAYFLWKYTDKDEKDIYNATMINTPPTNEAGYYSYAYLLSVKGITNTPTIQKLFQESVK